MARAAARRSHEKIRILKVPVGNILDIIGREKQDELKARMEAIRKVRSFA
ncbi:hypothetical protein [Methanoregula sp.]|nr:hypothetical protein [Methanoregula sp.]